MQVIIDSPHMDVDDKLKQLINEKIGNLVKWYNRIAQCKIVLKKDRNSRQPNYGITALVEVRGKSLFAREQAESFEAALQRIADDMRHQLFRYRRTQYGREEIW